MAASGSRPSAPSLAALPDDLLVACFEQLEDPLERRRVLPAVCSRWRRLVDEPPFLRSFELAFNGLDWLPHLAAFRGWVERRGAALRSLRLAASPPGQLLDGEEELVILDDAVQLHGELMRIVAACSGLQQLRVEVGDLWLPNIDISSLAAGLPSLQQLRLRAPGARLLLEAPLTSHSQLLDLRLKGSIVKLGPAAALPPALTRLHLGECIPPFGALGVFPEQVSLLPRLAHLCLDTLDCESDSISALSCLGSLTALEIHNCLSLPSPWVLIPLTNLRALALSTYADSVQAGTAIDAALRALPRLTALFLQLPPPLSPVVTGLVQLRYFAWHNLGLLDALPGGPWLAGLRKLAIVGPGPVSSLGVLQAATQLEHLGLGREASGSSDEAARLLQFASQHPKLQQLQLSGDWGVSREELQASAAASHLSISFVDGLADLVHAVVPGIAEETGFWPM